VEGEEGFGGREGGIGEEPKKRDGGGGLAWTGLTVDCRLEMERAWGPGSTRRGLVGQVHPLGGYGVSRKASEDIGRWMDRGWVGPLGWMLRLQQPSPAPCWPYLLL
jgi:hypothetical protein